MAARAARRVATFILRSTTPAAGAQDVAANTAISLQFSAPVSLKQTAPTLAPAIAGKWVQTNATTLTYALDSPLIPASQEVVTIPGGCARPAIDGRRRPGLHGLRRLRRGRG